MRFPFRSPLAFRGSLVTAAWADALRLGDEALGRADPRRRQIRGRLPLAHVLGRCSGGLLLEAMLWGRRAAASAGGSNKRDDRDGAEASS